MQLHGLSSQGWEPLKQVSGMAITEPVAVNITM